MRRTVSVTLAALLAAGTVTAAVTPAHASVNWQQRTCTAFAAWERHRTAAGLDRLVTVSLRLPHGYLAADVAQLLADSVTAKPKAKYITASARYVAEDCAAV